MDQAKERKWRGFPDPEAANAHIAVVENLLLLGGHYNVTLLGCAEYPGIILHFLVFKRRVL